MSRLFGLWVMWRLVRAMPAILVVLTLAWILLAGGRAERASAGAPVGGLERAIQGTGGTPAPKSTP